MSLYLTLLAYTSHSSPKCLFKNSSSLYVLVAAAKTPYAREMAHTPTASLPCQTLSHPQECNHDPGLAGTSDTPHKATDAVVYEGWRTME